MTMKPFHTTTTTPKDNARSLLIYVGSRIYVAAVLVLALIASGIIQESLIPSSSPSSRSLTTTNTASSSTVLRGPTSKQQQSVNNLSDASVEEIQSTVKSMGLVPIYDPKVTTDPWKAELFQRLDRIRIVCGKLCQMNTVEEVQKHMVDIPNSVLPMAQIQPVDCPAILALEDIDASDSSAPAIPDELKPYFTFNNTVEVTNHERRKDIALGVTHTKTWSRRDIDSYVQQAADGTLSGTYGVNATMWFREDVRQLPIRKKSILVIGSQSPWVEAILLYLGAAKVTTLEYSDIQSQHPQVEALQPYQFRERFLAGTLDNFDGVVTHSSLEHSGLGRYGDALNPWGDILAVARAWCVTKSGGFMYLGLPTGTDTIMSNWHRTYGKVRWPLVAANWRPMPSTGDGTELTRGVFAAFANGGFGYKFLKD